MGGPEMAPQPPSLRSVPAKPCRSSNLDRASPWGPFPARRGRRLVALDPATFVFPNLFAGLVKADHPVGGYVGERRVCLVDWRIAARTRLAMTLHDGNGIGGRRATGPRGLRRRPCALPR